MAALAGGLHKARPAEWLVYLAVLAYAGFYGWLAVRRHEAYQSSAMDLGYTVQALWNTAQGRLLSFSTFENAPVDLLLERFRRGDILLAYHVEPLLLPFSLLYRVGGGTTALLWLQAALVGTGALPIVWLARRRLGSDFAGTGFALAYLLAPAVEGATLSDFHAVTLTAALLAFALYFLETRRTLRYLAFVGLSLAATPGTTRPGCRCSQPRAHGWMCAAKARSYGCLRSRSRAVTRTTAPGRAPRRRGALLPGRAAPATRRRSGARHGPGLRGSHKRA